MACMTVLSVDGVGVSLISREQPGGRTLLGASDALSAQIEELQFELGEGPGVSAFREAQPVLVADILSGEARARWPMFTDAARAAGAGALFSFPLQVGTTGIGVLDCYFIRVGPLHEVAETLAVAEVVTLALLDLQARLAGEFTAGGDELFDLSWRNRAEVHQATGAIAVQLGISTGEALSRLRAHAFRYSRPLAVVAADVIAGKLRFAPEMQ